MTRPVTLSLEQLGDGSTADFNFQRIGMFLGEQGPIVNTLRQTASRASGGFDSDTQGQLVIFGAAIINTGTGLGSSFGIGVNAVASASVGVVKVTLTETFPTYTLLGVTLPKIVVGANVIGASAGGVAVRISTLTGNSITFQTLNSSGALVDAHFWFVGAGTLAPAS